MHRRNVSAINSRRVGNLHYLTNAPKNKQAPIPSQQPTASSSHQSGIVKFPINFQKTNKNQQQEAPSLRPPSESNSPEKGQQSNVNQPPSLVPPQDPLPSDESANENDDDIVFIEEKMGDPKADSKPNNPKRDESRGRPSDSRDRRPPGNQDRRQSKDRRDNSRAGGGGPKRDRFGGPSGMGHNSFSSQMKSGPPMLQPPAAFTQDIPKKKFTTRCRLFVGNLPNEMKEEEFKKLFDEFGEISEAFLSGKGFGFVRLDTRAHAEAAKEGLDGKNVHNRQLRVRFAVHGATIRVKELSAVVSNEMLYNTFSIFGEVERAIHIVDERGKPTGEGIVEFERKASAQEALRSIEERVFMMTAQSHPITVEIMETKDEEDGLAERMIQRTQQTMKEREIPPHFADEKSFEYNYGMRWKELYKFEKAQREQLEKDLVAKRKQLEADMEIAYDDYRAQMIREELEQRQRELERLEEARRNRAQTQNRPPGDFGSTWNQPAPRPYDDFSAPPPFGHLPPNPGGPMPLNFDGPQGRPAPTFGRDPAPRFFGGPPPEDLDQRQNPQEKPFGPEIDKILQTFRNEEPPPHMRGKFYEDFHGPGFGPMDNFGGPPPFNAPLAPPPLFSAGPMKHPHGPPYKPPMEKRSRR